MKSTYEIDLRRLYKDVILEYLEAYVLDPLSADIYEKLSKKIKTLSPISSLAKEPYWVKWFVTIRLHPAMKRLKIDHDTLINLNEEAINKKIDNIIDEIEIPIQPIASIATEVILNYYKEQTKPAYEIHKRLRVDPLEYHDFMKEVDCILKPCRKSRTYLRKLNDDGIKEIAKLIDKKRFDNEKIKEHKQRFEKKPDNYFTKKLKLLQLPMPQKTDRKLLEDFLYEKNLISSYNFEQHKSKHNNLSLGSVFSIEYSSTHVGFSDEALKELLANQQNLEERPQQISYSEFNTNSSYFESPEQGGQCNSEQISSTHVGFSDEALEELLANSQNLAERPQQISYSEFDTNSSYFESPEQGDQCNSEQISSTHVGFSDEALNKLPNLPQNLVVNTNDKKFRANLNQDSQRFNQLKSISNFRLYATPNPIMNQFEDEDENVRHRKKRKIDPHR